MNESKSRKVRFSKDRTEHGFFFRRQPRNIENVTLVARRREYFRVFLAINLVAQLPTKRGFLIHKNSLASCQRCRHSVEPRTLTCTFKQSNLSPWSLLSWHPTHTYLRRRLCFIQVVCCPPSRSRRVTQISASLERVRLKSTEACEYDS